MEIYIQLIKLKILKTEKNSIDYFHHSHNAPCLSPPPPLSPQFYKPIVLENNANPNILGVNKVYYANVKIVNARLILLKLFQVWDIYRYFMLYHSWLKRETVSY